MRNRLSSHLFALATLAAGLSVVLTPIVATAKQSTKATTLGNLRRVVYAATQYAQDYDQQTVLTQQGDAGFDKTWPVLLLPYLPDQTAYFDPTRKVVTTKTANLFGFPVLWSSVTTIGINDSGYSGRWATVGGTCTGRKINYLYGRRNIDAMEFPEKRIAFAPTSYANTGLGWSFFHSYESSWTKSGILASLFSWNNLVWNTKDLYEDKKIPAVRADGSAVSLNSGFFKSYTEANVTLATKAFCNWMENNGNGRPAWGRAWAED